MKPYNLELKIIKEYILNLINMKSKQEALNRLDSIEKEAQELRKIIEDADKPKPIKERVFDISSAIAELGEKDEDVKEYRKMQQADLSRKVLSGQEITLFCKALNGGKKMDLTNEDIQKWYVWFDCRKKVGSGFVYDLVYYHCFYSDSIPSRHLYDTQELAEHGSKCMEKTYYEYIIT